MAEMPGDVLDKMNAMHAPAETVPEDPPEQQGTSDDAEAAAESAPVGAQTHQPCVPAIPPSWTCADAGNTSGADTPSGETATIPGTPAQYLVGLLAESFNEPTPTAPLVSSNVSTEDTSAPDAPERIDGTADVAVPEEGVKGAKTDKTDKTPKISKGSTGKGSKGFKGGNGGKGGNAKVAKRGKHGK
jgi:hypothetical protein